MTSLKLPDGTSLHRYCVDNEVRYQTIVQYMNDGCTLEQAIDKYRNRPDKLKGKTKYLYKGIKVKSLLKTSEYYKFLSNIKKGMSFDEAIEEFLI